MLVVDVSTDTRISFLTPGDEKLYVLFKVWCTEDPKVLNLGS